MFTMLSPIGHFFMSKFSAQNFRSMPTHLRNGLSESFTLSINTDWGPLVNVATRELSAELDHNPALVLVAVDPVGAARVARVVAVVHVVVCWPNGIGNFRNLATVVA
jgi:hypothetical protein